MHGDYRCTLTATFYHQRSIARLVNATALELGIHTQSVTVLEATMTTAAGAEGIDPTLTFVLGTGVGRVAVVAIVLAVLRRRGGE